MGRSILIPNKFDCNCEPQGIITAPIWIYCLVNKDGKVRYVGSTADLSQTKNRHADKGQYVSEEFKMVLLGHFYDRSIAEFVEIKLIEEYIKQGQNLINKVTGFKDGRL